MKFIYVMDANSKDKLLAQGYKLISHDKHNGVWVFENAQTSKTAFELDVGVPHVLSNVLTF